MSEEQDAPNARAEGAPGDAELASLTSTDMMLQAAVLLLNIGGRRLGLAPPSASPEERAAAGAERDLDQVRDAIDAVRALLAVLGRTLSDELRPLRDALSQLQMAYAREVQSTAASTTAEGAGRGEGDPAGAPTGAGAGEGGGEGARGPKPRETPSDEDEGARRPGPAESSGRLWVPGR